MFRLESPPTNKLVLKPEMTPSLTRMILNVIDKEILPIKWYSIPQCWRDETVTRGRNFINEMSIYLEENIINQKSKFLCN
mgnify:FL=1